jgi:hypothetical protein
LTEAALKAAAKQLWILLMTKAKEECLAGFVTVKAPQVSSNLLPLPKILMTFSDLQIE